MTDIKAQILVEKIFATNLTNCQHVEQIIADKQGLSQEKYDLKNAFIESERDQLILEYLCKDTSTWPSLPEKDAEFKASRQKCNSVKTKYEDLKEDISNIVLDICQDHRELQQKAKMLEDKLKVYENKKKVFISKRNIDPATVKTAVEKCQQAVDAITTELSKLKEHQKQVIASISSNERQKHYRASSGVQKPVNQRAQNILSFLEKMNGVKVVETSNNTLDVEFQEQQSKPVDMNSSITDFNLTLTLQFNKDHYGNSRLSDVKVNIDHFNIKDIVEVALSTNDVQYLIRQVQDRWTRHFPMLSEIEILNKHHAIDWIQKDSKLRVLLRNCGNIMFTLAIPEDYPFSRNITLVDTYGIDIEDIESPPDAEASLMDWVCHLEDMYGEKS